MSNKKISAKIVADSISPQGHRITTFVLTYPRFIHAEVMTHRVFSRNAASSRAIPFKTMVKSIEEDPFIPIAWQKDHKGMQGTEYFTENDLVCDDPDIKDDVSFHLTQVWLKAMEQAVNLATYANSNGLTKQLCNRLLEPFQWYTCLVTATELDNFYELRCPKYKLTGLATDSVKSRKDWLRLMMFSSALHPSQYPKTEEEWWVLSESGAEIHIQALAEAMWDAQNESTPNKLKPGEWHIPFGDRMDDNKISEIFEKEGVRGNYWGAKEIEETKIKIATARSARLSYMTFDGKIDYEKDIALHDTLLASKHMSPFEHCARVMTDLEYYSFVKGSLEDQGYELSQWENGYSQEVYVSNNIQGWCNNFRGFIPYRYLVEHGNNTN